MLWHRWLTAGNAVVYVYVQYSPLGGKDIGGTSVLDYPQLKSIAKAVWMDGRDTLTLTFT